MFLVNTLQTSSDQEQSGSFEVLIVGFGFVSPLLPISRIAVFSKISMQSDTMVEKLLPL